ncbi:tektin-2-like [Huso huso]|uniref:Tektin n=1 Tax=Huso huso TaxID=61971 RepID=A0ABR0YPS0_HUSHU
MASLRVKPGQRLTVSDWHSNSHQISSNAERQRWGSHCTRQEARGLRSETSNKTKWDEQDTCTRLSDRIDEVTKWKDSLLKCLEDVDTEIKALTTVKESTEKALAATSLPLDVAIECLTLREGRRGNDLVRDPVEAELHKEVEVIDRARKVLQQKVSQAFEQLCLLQEVRQQLTFDLRHKIEALDVDRSCLSLNVNSAGLSLKLSPSRVPPGSTDPQQWEKFSHYNCNRAQEEMRASTQLREAMRVIMGQTHNELEAQRVACDFALRKRHRELERALDELHWQQSNMKEEIQEMENDLRGLEDDLQAKMAPLKLAHTRLETRTYRPGADLCRDQVQHGLTDEVQQLEGTMTALKQKRAQSQDVLHALSQQLTRIEEDIACKTSSLSLERRSLDTRSKLIVPPEKHVPETDTFNRTLSPVKSRQLELA